MYWHVIDVKKKKNRKVGQRRKEQTNRFPQNHNLPSIGSSTISSLKKLKILPRWLPIRSLSMDISISVHLGSEGINFFKKLC